MPNAPKIRNFTRKFKTKFSRLCSQSYVLEKIPTNSALKHLHPGFASARGCQLASSTENINQFEKSFDEPLKRLECNVSAGESV